jgi:hypothetical protein
MLEGAVGAAPRASILQFYKAMAGIKEPKDGDLDSSAIRIRDNQRRSRARRKEYLEDMQKKLQTYEREGVQATLDMQQAAKRVALENDRLRILLNQRGVTDNEISQYLQSFPPNPPEAERKPLKAQPISAPRSPPLQQDNLRLRMAVPPLHLGHAAFPAGRHQHLSMQSDAEAMFGPTGNSAYHSAAIRTPPEYGPPTQQPGHSYMDVVLPPIHTLTKTDGPPVDRLSVLADASTERACCDGQAQCTSSAEVLQAPSPAATNSSFGHAHSTSPLGNDVYSPTEMSCSDAAQIIANMHGHGDITISKAALGCGGREECVVKNSHIFDVLESRPA